MPEFPNIDHILRERMADSLRDGFVGTEDELQAAVDGLIAFARKQGQLLRESATDGHR